MFLKQQVVPDVIGSQVVFNQKLIIWSHFMDSLASTCFTRKKEKALKFS